MATITINRGEPTSIPFKITDTGNGLVGKRVSWTVSFAVNGDRLLRKVGALPGSSADITITSQVAGEIDGTINLVAADFANLPVAENPFVATLWIDDGGGGDRCTTVGGVDSLKVVDNVPRAA